MARVTLVLTLGQTVSVYLHAFMALECMLKVYTITSCMAYHTVPSVEAVKNSAPVLALTQMARYTGSK